VKVLEEDPIRPRPGADIRPLWAHDDPPLYRLRVGDDRVLYLVLQDEVRVTEGAHRSQAYRGLD
jgi:mRNA-degrading endonuclease RelE of RelBE toxin-antitoxin system